MCYLYHNMNDIVGKGRRCILSGAQSLDRGRTFSKKKRQFLLLSDLLSYDTYICIKYSGLGCDGTRTGKAYTSTSTGKTGDNWYGTGSLYQAKMRYKSV